MQKKVTVRNCPCCGKFSAIKFTDVSFLNDECPLPEHYDIVGCIYCGFCYADMYANQETFNLYYEKYNNYGYDSKIKIESLHNTPYENICNIIKEFVKKDKKIIDIGCGGGDVLHLLSYDGYKNIYGLDPSQRAVELLNDDGIYGVLGNIFDSVDADNLHAYDMVISTCVMEHIYDLNQYIEQLKLYMRDSTDAILFISVPSVAGFPRQITPKPNYFNREHINFFSIGSLDNLMSQHGLKRINTEFNYYYKNEEYIYGMYRLVHDTSPLIKKDEIGQASIEAYLKEWDNKQKAIDDKVKKIRARDSNIIVFGMGSYVEWLLTKYPVLRDQILFGVDNNIEKHNSIFAGIPIYGADKITEYADELIVICSMLYADQIKEQLMDMHIKNDILIM